MAPISISISRQPETIGLSQRQWQQSCSERCAACCRRDRGSASGCCFAKRTQSGAQPLRCTPAASDRWCGRASARHCKARHARQHQAALPLLAVVASRRGCWLLVVDPLVVLRVPLLAPHRLRHAPSIHASIQLLRLLLLTNTPHVPLRICWMMPYWLQTPRIHFQLKLPRAPKDAGAVHCRVYTLPAHMQGCC